MKNDVLSFIMIFSVPRCKVVQLFCVASEASAKAWYSLLNLHNNEWLFKHCPLFNWIIFESLYLSAFMSHQWCASSYNYRCKVLWRSVFLKQINGWDMPVVMLHCQTNITEPYIVKRALIFSFITLGVYIYTNNVSIAQNIWKTAK